MTQDSSPEMKQDLKCVAHAENHPAGLNETISAKMRREKLLQ